LALSLVQEALPRNEAQNYQELISLKTATSKKKTLKTECLAPLAKSRADELQNSVHGRKTF
jgi:hypothetical protein